MLSKGGLIEYLCPVCQSPDIRQGKMYGQNSGFCKSPECNTWWPWKSRIKKSVNEKAKHVARSVNGYINLYPVKN